MGIPEDRRLNPFNNGSRSVTVGVHEGVLLPKQGGEIFAKMRDDWVLFPIKGPETPQPTQESGTTASETKEVAPAQNQNVGTPVPYTGKTSPAVKKSVEERLMILNELRNKKLITEEEFRTKKLDILNDL
jgi:hypothetical protein